MPDDREQPPTDGLRLTYAAIAGRLGISGEAARQLVRRRGWRRIIPNRQGAPAIIIVPEDELAAEQWRQSRSDRATSPDEGDTPPDVRPTSSDTAILEAEISRLSTLLGAAGERADRAEQRSVAADADRRQADIRIEAAEADRRQADADRRAAETRGNQAEQRAEAERERANRAQAGRESERARADALRDRLLVMQEQLADAHGALQAAEATTARADRDKEQAEAGREAERARADALRDQVASLQAQVTAAQAEAKAVNDRAWATGEQLGAAEQRAMTERERADRLASNVAHERQDFLDAESRTRRELDEIRQRLEQAEENREAAAELHRQVEVRAASAEAAAEAALQEAVELKAAAEAAGRGGRWARLRRAWRGA
jgi:DNA repair exonuclease SbcCD ATPase subunit